MSVDKFNTAYFITIIAFQRINSNHTHAQRPWIGTTERVTYFPLIWRLVLGGGGKEKIKLNYLNKGLKDLSNGDEKIWST